MTERDIVRDVGRITHRSEDTLRRERHVMWLSPCLQAWLLIMYYLHLHHSHFRNKSYGMDLDELRQRTGHRQEGHLRRLPVSMLINTNGRTLATVLWASDTRML